MNIHSLHESINRLCYFLDEEYNINNGGCCFVASVIAKHFDYLKIPYSLVTYADLERDIDYIQHEVSCKVRNTSQRKSVTGIHTCTHYCLLIEGAGEVNSGEFDDCHKYIIKDIHSANIRWICRNGLWNKEYDTNNNTIIKGIIKAFFKRYETELPFN